MPESVADRPTKAHEQVFIFAKAKWSGPQPRRFAHLSDSDARWLALFLDTEGTITVKRASRPDGRVWYGTQVSFAGTSFALVSTARDIVGAGAVLERAGTNAPMFYFQVSNRVAADLLHRIYPFLIIKQRQARIGLHVQDLLAQGGKKRPGGFRDASLTDRLERLWAANKSCNHFGDPDLSWVPVPEFGRWADCERYYWDAEAVKEPYETAEHHARYHGKGDSTVEANKNAGNKAGGNGGLRGGALVNFTGRNIRSVWSIATQPYSGAHFATMPEKLVERCVLAASRHGDLVLDPFVGSGTVARVAISLGRRAVGCDLNRQYLALAEERTQVTMGLPLEFSA